MAIDSVKVTINGVTTALVRDHDNPNLFRATLAAPNKTSYNINSGHYYPVTVTATNQAGTEVVVNDTDSALGSSLRLRVKELTAPTITINAPTSGQYLGTSTPTIKFTLTDDANGSGVAISTLSFELDGKTYTNTSTGVSVSSVTNGYQVTFVPPTAISDGSHTLAVNVKDNDGNAASSKGVEFITDTIAPSLSITYPPAGIYVPIPNIAVTGTVSDSTSGNPTVKITLNGTDLGTVDVSNGSFAKSVTLVSGENTIVVTATDLAGKVTTITRTVILDTSKPVIASVTITPNPVNVNGSYTVTVEVQ